MKRVGNLYQKLLTFDNFSDALKKASRGKKNQPRIAAFLLQQEQKIFALIEEIRSHTYYPRPFRVFEVSRPKTRKICAADFRDRVAHHAICNIISPILEQSLIFDSYACRQKKGTHAAVKRTQQFCRLKKYYLKIDIHKYFDSIDHKILKKLLSRKIKDKNVLRLLDVIIKQKPPWTSPGTGLPIGNLTSQHFANYYLSSVDHYTKHYLKIGSYLRYMDDAVFFADEKQTLWDAFQRVKAMLEDDLQLKIKKTSVHLSPVSEGLPFLGFVIFPGIIRLSRKGFRRFRRKIISREGLYQAGIIDEHELTQSVASLIGHTHLANSVKLRQNFF